MAFAARQQHISTVPRALQQRVVGAMPPDIDFTRTINRITIASPRH